MNTEQANDILREARTYLDLREPIPLHWAVEYSDVFSEVWAHGDPTLQLALAAHWMEDEEVVLAVGAAVRPFVTDERSIRALDLVERWARGDHRIANGDWMRASVASKAAASSAGVKADALGDYANYDATAAIYEAVHVVLAVVSPNSPEAIDYYNNSDGVTTPAMAAIDAAANVRGDHTRLRDYIAAHHIQVTFEDIVNAALSGARK